MPLRWCWQDGTAVAPWIGSGAMRECVMKRRRAGERGNRFVPMAPQVGARGACVRMHLGSPGDVQGRRERAKGRCSCVLGAGWEATILG